MMRFFLFCILLSTQVVAESVPSRFSFFGGVSGGYTQVETDISTEANKTGFHFDTELLASYHLEPVIFDLGLGWIFNRVTGSGGVIVEDTIKTYGGFLDFATRYAFGGRWQFGLGTKTAFGSNFNFGGNQSETNLAFFAGPQLAYQIETSSFIYRFLLTGLADLNISDRQVYMALAGFQVGLPLTRNASVTVADTSVESKRSMTINMGVLGFAVGTAQLQSAEISKLRQIADVLRKYQSEWDSLHIGGHTDDRGNEKLNAGLSMQRAMAAKKVLVAAGIPKSAITAEGFSFHQPKATGTGEDIWSQNRRVEIKVQGALKASTMEKIMKEIAD